MNIMLPRHVTGTFTAWFNDSFNCNIWWVSFKRVRKIAKSDYWLLHVCSSVCPSALNNSAPTGRVFMKFHEISENLSRKLKLRENLTAMTGTLH